MNVRKNINVDTLLTFGYRKICRKSNVKIFSLFFIVLFFICRSMISMFRWKKYGKNTSFARFAFYIDMSGMSRNNGFDIT